MLLHVFLWTFEYFHNRGRNFLRSTSPICMYSEFPRSFLVSTVLIGLFIILVCLFGQILYTISSQVINDNFGFNDSSIIYFSAYILTNLLFLAHLGLYFGYKESLTLDDQMLQVNQGLFNMQWRRQIPLENIFFHQCCQSSMGNYHILIFYHDENGRTQRIHVGSYLDEPHLEILTHSFDRIYSDKLLVSSDH